MGLFKHRPGSTRPLLDKTTPLRACGPPLNRGQGNISYALFAPEEAVYPLPESPIPISQQLCAEPTLGAIHNGTYFYVSAQEPWSAETWIQHGYCQLTSTQWTEGPRLTRASLFRLPISHLCLENSGTTPSGYCNKNTIHLVSLTLDDPAKAADFFGQPLLAKLPRKTHLQRALFDLPKIHVPLQDAIDDILRQPNLSKLDIFTDTNPFDSFNVPSKFIPSKALVDPFNKYILATDTSRIPPSFISLARASRKFGRVQLGSESITFADWLKAHRPELLYTFVLAPGNKQTKKTFLYKKDFNAIQEAINTTTNWVQAIEEECGISLPKNLLHVLNSDKARKWAAFQKNRVNLNYVSAVELHEALTEIAKVSIPWELKKVFPYIHEPVTQSPYCVLPEGSTLHQRIQAFFQENPKAFLQFLGIIGPQLPTLINACWGPTHKSLLTLQNL